MLRFHASSVAHVAPAGTWVAQFNVAFQAAFAEFASLAIFWRMKLDVIAMMHPNEKQLPMFLVLFRAFLFWKTVSNTKTKILLLVPWANILLMVAIGQTFCCAVDQIVVAVWGFRGRASLFMIFGLWIHWWRSVVVK